MFDYAFNIAGEKLTDQELRNAIYTGEWLSDAKKYFSKTQCPAYNMASDYMKGSTIRQDYLETVLFWASNDNIEDYMSNNQNSPNANALWLYFNEVIKQSFYIAGMEAVVTYNEEQIIIKAGE